MQIVDLILKCAKFLKVLHASNYIWVVVGQIAVHGLGFFIHVAKIVTHMVSFRNLSTGRGFDIGAKGVRWQSSSAPYFLHPGTPPSKSIEIVIVEP